MSDVENVDEAARAEMATSKIGDKALDNEKSKRKTALNIVLFVILAVTAGRFWVQYQDAKEAQIVREQKVAEIRATIKSEIEKAEQSSILSFENGLGSSQEALLDEFPAMPHSENEEIFETLDVVDTPHVPMVDLEEADFALIDETPVLTMADDLKVSVETFEEDVALLDDATSLAHLSLNEVSGNVSEIVEETSALDDSVVENNLLAVKTTELAEDIVPAPEPMAQQEATKPKAIKPQPAYMWEIKAISKKQAVLYSSVYNMTKTVGIGAKLPLLGRVKSIDRNAAGKWQVVTEIGKVVQK